MIFSITDTESDMLHTILLQIRDDDQDISSISENHNQHNIIGNLLDLDHPSNVIIVISPFQRIEYSGKKEIRICLTENNSGMIGTNSVFHYSIFFN